jgi:small redox-active disulfide protein 2
MVIKILGSGCPNCKTLERRAIEAADELSIKAEFLEVRDFKEIASYGIMHTPGLVINEKVVSAGYVPKTEEIKSLILANADKV